METTSPAGDQDSRSLFAARLSALATGKLPAETAPAKKTASSLTGRFFGGKDKQGPARTDDDPGTRAEPREQSPAPAVSATGPAVAAGPTSLPATSGETPPLATNHAADAVGGPSTPEGGASVPLPGRPAAARRDFLEPRITVPSFHYSQPAMTPTPTGDQPPAVGRASAQLTLGFEVTSLQLTPFFRLGSLQLKALSDVVSLDLVAARQVDNPLAAGISFQIERVELDSAARLKSILLKPLGESRELVAPLPRLQVDSVTLTGENEDNPISVTTADASATTVQLVGMFAIAAMEFSPAFEIDAMRLEPVSNTVLLRVVPSSGSDAQGLPASFEFAEVQLGEGAQIRGARLVPGTAENA